MKKVIDSQIELLKKYYEYDEKTKTFDVVFHYEKVTELFDTTLVTKTPRFKEEVLQSVIENLKDIPHGYKADVSFVIDDFENYDKKIVLSSINDLVFLIRYRFAIERRIKWIKIASLLTVGVLLLVLSTIFGVKSFWGTINSELVQAIIIGVMEIASWVFVWEAVSMMFLEKSKILRSGQLLLTKTNNVELYHSDSEKALAKESSKDILEALVKGKGK